jgi:hypothetical protein
VNSVHLTGEVFRDVLRSVEHRHVDREVGIQTHAQFLLFFEFAFFAQVAMVDGFYGFGSFLVMQLPLQLILEYLLLLLGRGLVNNVLVD